MSLRLFVLSCLAFFALVGSLPACSVPVFRYALERWSPDLFEVSVFFRGTLNDANAKRLNQLEDLAIHNGGAVNWEVVRCNLDEPVPADLVALWTSLPDVPLPLVIVRMPRKTTGQSILWQGPLDDPVFDHFATSRARREIAQRLLQGDAVVWVLVRGTDQSQATHAKVMLDSSLVQLADEIELPPGVGLPGSELLAKIPLHLTFSVVEVPASSREEQTLVRLLLGGLPKPPDAGDSYLAPVFGRGRVLDVRSAREVDSDTISDLTRYLCSACSCQVKQQNPGFDLLCAMNWDERLFDETSDRSTLGTTDSPTVSGASATDTEPIFVAIPTGHKPLVAATSSTNLAPSSPRTHYSLLVAIAALAAFTAWIAVTK